MTNAPRPQILFGLTLSAEISGATQLLAGGLNQIVEPSWYASEPAAAFTCLSSGIERVLKLTYGLDSANQGTSFANAGALRKLGHDLVAVDSVMGPRLLESAAQLGKDYVTRLITEANNDQYWRSLLATLNAWAAASGRYRDLTILSGDPVDGDSPASMWQAVESRCITDLGLLAAIAGPDNRAALIQVRTRLALSILKWWFAIYRAWTHGLLGAERISPGTGLPQPTTVSSRPPWHV